jgi:hypothetical protein
MQIVPLQTALKGGVKGGAKGDRQPVRCMLLQCRTACCSSNPHRVATLNCEAAPWSRPPPSSHAWLDDAAFAVQLTGALAVLEAAAESVDSLVAGTQAVCEAIVGNPKYKPFVMKHLPLDNRHSSSSVSSSSDSSSQGGVARAA